MPTSFTRLEIRVKADLDIGQNVRITGNHQLLGNFHPNRGLDLVTTPALYPMWYTDRPINIPSGLPLSYKYLVFSGGQFHRWEPISARSRNIIPHGSEMVVEDELGVFTESSDQAVTQDTLKSYRMRLDEPTSRFAAFGQPSIIHQANSGEGPRSGSELQIDCASKDDFEKVSGHLLRGAKNENRSIGVSETVIEKESGAIEATRNIRSPEFATSRNEKINVFGSQDIVQPSAAHKPSDLLKTSGSYQNIFPDSPLRSQGSSDLEDSRKDGPGIKEGVGRLYMVSFNLPVNLHIEKNQLANEWRAEWNTYNISCKTRNKMIGERRVVWVGYVTPFVICDNDIELAWSLSEDDQTKIKLALKDMDCVPIFLTKDLFLDHFVRYGLRLQDVFHNVMVSKLPNENVMRFVEQYLPPSATDKATPFVENKGSCETDDCRSDCDGWDGFVCGCTNVADVIMNLLGRDISPRDLIWVHNYPLMLLPLLLRERFLKSKPSTSMHPLIVFFLHIPFPTSELFRTLSARKELLQGILGANLLGFHTFDHARHFLTSCRRFLGLQFRSQQGGRLVVDYDNRSVLLAISHMGIERDILDLSLLSKEAVKHVNKIRDKYKGKIIIAGMDEITRLQGIPLKLLAFERLLNNVERYRDKLVIIQHGLHTLNPRLRSLAEEHILQKAGYQASIDGFDVGERAAGEVRELCARINRRFGPIAVFEEYESYQWPTESERAAIFAAADIFVSTPVCEGVNLLPLEYTYCHRNPSGVVIVSEFSAASRVLNGGLRVNCYDMEEICHALDQALSMSVREKNTRRDRDCHYIASRSIAFWTLSIVKEAESIFHEGRTSFKDKEIIEAPADDGHGIKTLGISTAHGDHALDTYLPMQLVLKGYLSSIRRIFFLDYEAALMGYELGTVLFKCDFLGLSEKMTTKKSLEVLKRLCMNPCNVVFIVSSNPAEVMTSEFADLLSNEKTPLGIVAHSGVAIHWGHIPDLFIKASEKTNSRNFLESESAIFEDKSTAHEKQDYGTQNRSSSVGFDEWEFMLHGITKAWARWIEAAKIIDILEEYTWRTGGSTWRQTDVSTTWLFSQADPEWGEIQAEKLCGELEEAINDVNVPIVVARRKYAVELLPRGIDTGNAIEYILRTLRSRYSFIPRFCFCAGNDMTGASMFQAVSDFMGDLEISKFDQNEGNRVSSSFGRKKQPLILAKKSGSEALPGKETVAEPFSHTFTCTVGHNPTIAQYFIPDSDHLLQVLDDLAQCSASETTE